MRNWKIWTISSGPSWMTIYGTRVQWCAVASVHTASPNPRRCLRTSSKTSWCSLPIHRWTPQVHLYECVAFVSQLLQLAGPRLPHCKHTTCEVKTSRVACCGEKLESREVERIKLRWSQLRIPLNNKQNKGRLWYESGSSRSGMAKFWETELWLPSNERKVHVLYTLRGVQGMRSRGVAACTWVPRPHTSIHCVRTHWRSQAKARITSSRPYTSLCLLVAHFKQSQGITRPQINLEVNRNFLELLNTRILDIL